MWYWLGWGVTDIRRCNRATRSMSQWQCTANLTLYRCLFQLRAAVIEESSPHCTKQRFNTYGVLWIWNLKGTCPVFSRNETSPFFSCPLLGLQQRIVGWCGNHESFESGGVYTVSEHLLCSRDIFKISTARLNTEWFTWQKVQVQWDRNYNISMI